MSRYRKRKFSLIGIVLFLFLLWFVSGFIWKIEITGNNRISDEQILAYLEQEQYGYGCKKKDLSSEQIEAALRSEFDDIIWTAVKVEGTKLSITVQENIPGEVKQDANIKYDLVAPADGTIRSIITRTGTPMVKNNDQVSKGDILVTSRIEITNDSGEVQKYEYGTADADILFETSVFYSDRINQRYIRKNKTGNTRKRFSLHIFNYRIPLYFRKIPYDHFDIYTVETPVRLSDNFYLPVILSRNNIVEYVPEQADYSVSELKQMEEEKLQAYFENLEQKDIQIIEKNVKMELLNGIYYTNGAIRILEPVESYMPTQILELQTEGTDNNESNGEND